MPSAEVVRTQLSFLSIILEYTRAFWVSLKLAWKRPAFTPSSLKTSSKYLAKLVLL